MHDVRSISGTTRCSDEMSGVAVESLFAFSATFLSKVTTSAAAVRQSQTVLFKHVTRHARFAQALIGKSFAACAGNFFTTALVQEFPCP
jgi:hypothetical protein